MTTAPYDLKTTISREPTRLRKPKDKPELTNTPAAILAELEAAQKDLLLFQKLQTAEKRVERLSREYDRAVAAQAQEEAAALAAAKAARFEGISNVRVTGNDQGGPLFRNWRITFTGMAWDIYQHRNRMMETTVQGFGELLDRHRPVFDYLLEVAPDRIPAEIMALAPGDPGRAFEELFAAERRGYLRGTAGQ